MPEDLIIRELRKEVRKIDERIAEIRGEMVLLAERQRRAFDALKRLRRQGQEV